MMSTPIAQIVAILIAVTLSQLGSFRTANGDDKATTIVLRVYDKSGFVLETKVARPRGLRAVLEDGQVRVVGGLNVFSEGVKQINIERWDAGTVTFTVEKRGETDSVQARRAAKVFVEGGKLQEVQVPGSGAAQRLVLAEGAELWAFHNGKNVFRLINGAKELPDEAFVEDVDAPKAEPDVAAREVDPPAESAEPKELEEIDPLDLDALLKEVEQLVDRGDWKRRVAKDSKLERMLIGLMTHVCEGTEQPPQNMPVEFGTVVPARDPRQRNQLHISRGGRLGRLERSIVLVDGSIDITNADYCVIVATKQVEISHGRGNWVVAGDLIDYAHDNNRGDRPPFKEGSLVVSGGVAEISHGRGSTCAAKDYFLAGSFYGGRLLNLPLREIAVPRDTEYFQDDAFALKRNVHKIASRLRLTSVAQDRTGHIVSLHDRESGKTCHARPDLELTAGKETLPEELAGWKLHWVGQGTAGSYALLRKEQEFAGFVLSRRNELTRPQMKTPTEIYGDATRLAASLKFDGHTTIEWLNRLNTGDRSERSRIEHLLKWQVATNLIVAGLEQVDNEEAREAAYSVLISKGQMLNSHPDRTAKSAVALLANATKDKNLRIRHRAAHALGNYGRYDPDRARAALVAALEDEEIRTDAARSLRDLGAENVTKVLPELREILQQPWPDELDTGEVSFRATVMYALWVIGDKAVAVVPELIHDLRRGPPAIHTRVAETLNSIGPLAAPATEDLKRLAKLGTPEASRSAVAALNRIGIPDEEMLPLLLVGLASNDDRTLRTMANIAGEKPKLAEELVPKLALHLEDEEDRAMRDTYIFALSRIGAGQPLAAKALIEKLRSEDRNLRRRVVEALGEFNADDELAIQALMEAVNDDDTHVVHAAAGSLAKMGPEIVPRLSVGLSVDEVKGRGFAKALSFFGSDAASAVPALMEAMRSEDVFLRRNAMMALGNVGPDAQYAVPALHGLLLEGKDDSFQAAMALGKIGQPALDSLLEAADSDEPLVRRAALAGLVAMGAIGKPAVPVFAKMLNDDDEATRDWALRGLHGLGPLASESADSLRTAMKSDNKVFRVRAAVAYIAIEESPRQALPVLIESVGDPGLSSRLRDDVNNAILSVGELAVSELLEAMDTTPEKRHATVFLFSRLGPAAVDAAPVLIEVLRTDKSYATRRQAAEALGNLGLDKEEVRDALGDALTDDQRIVRAAAETALLKISAARENKP